MQEVISSPYGMLFAYLLGLLHTFGHVIRTGRSGRAGFVRAVVYSVIRPVYWIVIHGIAGTLLNLSGSIRAVAVQIVSIPIDILKIIVDFIFSILRSTIDLAVALCNGAVSSFRVRPQVIELAYTFGACMMPAWYLYHTWDSCGGMGSCSLVIAKALLWGVFWPAYMLAIFI